MTANLVIGLGGHFCNSTRFCNGPSRVNLLTVFIERRTIMHADAFAATQTSDNSTTMEFLRQVAGLVQASGLPESQLLPTAASFLGQSVVAQATNAAFQDGFLVVFGIFLLALIPTWFMWRARSPAS